MPPRWGMLYTVHCTLYTVHCTLYTVHCTLYTYALPTQLGTKDHEMRQLLEKITAQREAYRDLMQVTHTHVLYITPDQTRPDLYTVLDMTSPDPYTVLYMTSADLYTSLYNVHDPS